MKSTTAQQFGSLGKSFGAPAAAAAVIGAALLASDTSDTSETAWSPSAACLLPDVLPIAGTLLSYGGNRQLAAGGTVSHSGALNLGANALTVGAITASGTVTVSGSGSASSPLLNFSGAGTGNAIGLFRNGFHLGLATQDTHVLHVSFNTGIGAASGNYFGISNNVYDPSGTHDVKLSRNATGPAWVACAAGGLQIRNLANSADAALTCGAITASGVMTVNGVTLTGNSSYGLLYSSASIVADGFFASSGSTNKVWVSNAHGTRVASGLGFQFATNEEVSNPPDLQLTRQSAGVLQIGTTTANASGSLLLTNITASGAVQETPTQSALDPTTTNIPSGKRMGWYNTALSEFRDWVNIGGTLLKSAAYT